MSKIQIKAIFLICLLFGAEAVRVSEETYDGTGPGGNCAAKHQNHMNDLAEKVASKTEKVKTGIDAIQSLNDDLNNQRGWALVRKKFAIRREEKAQKKRILKLGFRTKALAACVAKLKEACALENASLNFSKAQEELGKGRDTIKQLASKNAGEGFLGRVGVAIQCTDSKLPALEEMSDEEKSANLHKIMLGMLEALNDGECDMPEGSEDSEVSSSALSSMLDEQADEAIAEENLNETVEDSDGQSLVETYASDVSNRYTNPLVRFGQIVFGCILLALYVVGFLVYNIGMFAAGILMWPICIFSSLLSIKKRRPSEAMNKCYSILPWGGNKWLKEEVGDMGTAYVKGAD